MSEILTVRMPETLIVYLLHEGGRCKSWTLDSGLDRGLDHGLDFGPDFGPKFGPSFGLVIIACFV